VPPIDFDPGEELELEDVPPPPPPVKPITPPPPVEFGEPEIEELPIMPPPPEGLVGESELKGVEDIQNQIFEKRYNKLVKAVTKK